MYLLHQFPRMSNRTIKTMRKSSKLVIGESDLFSDLEIYLEFCSWKYTKSSKLRLTHLEIDFQRLFVISIWHNKIVIMCELLEVCVPLCMCMFRTCQFGMIFIYGLISCVGECIQECCPNCCNKCLHTQQKPISVEDVRVSCDHISLPIFED